MRRHLYRHNTFQYTVFSTSQLTESLANVCSNGLYVATELRLRNHLAAHFENSHISLAAFQDECKKSDISPRRVSQYMDLTQQ